MKRFLLAVFCCMAVLTSCEDNTNIIFTDYYVCIKSEEGASKSTVPCTSNDLTVTYYVSLIAPTLDSDIVVNYEIIPGDGLKEGVDYKLQTQARSVKIARGVLRMPIRVTYLANPLDASKDNTLTIKLTSCSNSKLHIGYPGPSALYSSHIISKVNN